MPPPLEQPFLCLWEESSCSAGRTAQGPVRVSCTGPSCPPPAVSASLCPKRTVGWQVILLGLPRGEASVILGGSGPPEACRGAALRLALSWGGWGVCVKHSQLTPPPPSASHSRLLLPLYVQNLGGLGSFFGGFSHKGPNPAHGASSGAFVQLWKDPPSF